MSKKLMEEQAKKKEENKEKHKKVDYRKFANKYFKNPTDHLPLIIEIKGFGKGKITFCSKCNRTPVKSKCVIRNDETIWLCGDCGNRCILKDKRE